MKNGRLRPGDLIVRVGEVSARGLGPDQVARLLRQSVVANFTLAATTPNNFAASSSISSTTSSTSSTNNYNNNNKSVSNAANSFASTTSMPPNSASACSATSTSTTTMTTVSTVGVLPVRLVVSRQAQGHPADLAAIFQEQRRQIRQGKLLGSIWYGQY